MHRVGWALAKASPAGAGVGNLVGTGWREGVSWRLEGPCTVWASGQSGAWGRPERSLSLFIVCLDNSVDKDMNGPPHGPRYKSQGKHLKIQKDGKSCSGPKSPHGARSGHLEERGLRVLWWQKGRPGQGRLAAPFKGLGQFSSGLRGGRWVLPSYRGRTWVTGGPGLPSSGGGGRDSNPGPAGLLKGPGLDSWSWPRPQGFTPPGELGMDEALVWAHK